MIEFKRIIEELKNMKQRLNLIIHPQTPEVLVCYLNGFARGILLSDISTTFEDLVSARRASNKLRGWKDSSMHPFHEMREKGISEDTIIQEILEIEIQIWKILEQWENEQ